MNDEMDRESAGVLTAAEARVVACLIEKEMATPEYYPLTLNALKAACNQKSNRNPAMTLDEDAILAALEQLRYEHQMAWEVTVAGSRVMKYKHAILDHFNFERRDIAVVCELMLRGPQTVGELRSHTKRFVEFDSLPQIEEHLRGLMDWGGRKLVTKLPPVAGNREARYAHLLCGEEETPQDEEGEPRDVAPPAPTGAGDRVAALAEEVAVLREEVAALRRQLAEEEGRDRENPAQG